MKEEEKKWTSQIQELFFFCMYEHKVCVDEKRIRREEEEKTVAKQRMKQLQQRQQLES